MYIAAWKSSDGYDVFSPEDWIGKIPIQKKDFEKLVLELVEKRLKLLCSDEEGEIKITIKSS